MTSLQSGLSSSNTRLNRNGLPRSLRPRASGEIVLKPVRPDLGLAAAYRKKLEAMVENVHRSALWWLRAKYRANPPKIAQDAEPGATPAEILIEAIRDLRDRWLAQIEDTAPKLAEYFNQAVERRSTAVLRKILLDGGIAVKFEMTAAMRDVYAASVAENVSLIRSIPARYFDQIEGIIMRGFANGYDLKRVTDDLQKQFGVTRRRAAFIARDQSSKVNAQFTRARHLELGIEEAVWMHSHAGKQPRPSHVQAGREKVRYNIAEGWFDPDEGKNIWPGELINCRCVGRPVIRPAI